MSDFVLVKHLEGPEMPDVLPAGVEREIEDAGHIVNNAILVAEHYGIETKEIIEQDTDTWSSVKMIYPTPFGYFEEDLPLFITFLEKIRAIVEPAIDEKGYAVGDAGAKLAQCKSIVLDGSGSLMFRGKRHQGVESFLYKLKQILRQMEFARDHDLMVQVTFEPYSVGEYTHEDIAEIVRILRSKES